MRDIPSSNILLGEEIIKIDRERHLAYTINSLISYEKIVNTTALNNFVRLVGISGIADVLSCNKVLVLNLGFDKKSKFDNIHWIYVPDKNINFYRIGFYDNILNQNKLSMYVEIGYHENEFINVEMQLQETLDNLRQIGIIDDHILIDYHYCFMKPAYVHITKESKK